MIESKKSKLLESIVCNFIFIVVSIACLAPLILVVVISFSDEKMVLQNGYSFWPQGVNLDAYRYILKDPWQIVSAYRVSIMTTTIGSVLGLLFTVLMAYPLSRSDFRFRKQLSFMVFFTMLFNGGLVPSYILIAGYLNLNDNFWVLILPNLITPWYIILMKSFFSELPNEIVEAATIDGASEFRTLFTIVMPIAKPALATVGLLIILRYWNDWMLAMLYIQDKNLIPLQFFLYRMLNNIEEMQKNRMFFDADIAFPQEPVRMAMAVLASTPILIIFPFLQKYFVRGLTVGSVKG